MTSTQVPKLALVAPFQEKEVEPEVKALLSQLGGQVPQGYREDQYELLPLALRYEGYEATRIKLDEKEPIPDDTKTLIVVEPRELNERQTFEINRFVRGGGSLLLAVQNYEYLYTASGNQLSIEPKEKKPGVDSFLSSWGFEVDEQILADAQHDVVNLSGGARLGPFELSVPVKVPIQILITRSGMNPNISITSRLSSLFYLWGTGLKLNDEKIKSENLKVETLITSSADSWTVPFQAGAMTPENFAPRPDSKHGPFPLAVMAQGQFADTYEGKPAPAWPVAATVAAEIKSVETSQPKPVTPASGKMILMGCASWFQKNLLRNGGHLNLFLNSVDALTLGDELVTIRSKQPIDRSLPRISAAAKVGWRLFVSLFIPALIAAIGTFRVILRRQSKQNYLKVLSLAE